MRKLKRKHWVGFGVGFGALTIGCSALVPQIAERAVNRKIANSDEFAPAIVDCGSGCGRMRDLFVADLHADTLLWGRDPRNHTSVGHVDLHRLREAGVDLQVFSVPSKTPYSRAKIKERLPTSGGQISVVRGDLDCTNGEAFDTTKWLYLLSGRVSKPSRAIAYQQAERFCRMTAGTWIGDTNQCLYSESRLPTQHSFFAVRTARDLAALQEAVRNTLPGEAKPVGALLAIEGVHWIPVSFQSEQIRNEINALKEAGFRMIGLTHKFTNTLGGSDEDCSAPIGLTSLGVEAVKAVFDAGLILDVAHLSKEAIHSKNKANPTVVTLAQSPEYRDKPRVVMSHGAVRTEDCRNLRNLPETTVQALLSMDHPVPYGMIHWNKAYCLPNDASVRESSKLDRSLNAEKAIIDSYARIIALFKKTDEAALAVRSLAIGADLDGAITAPYDVTGFPHLLWRMSRQPWCVEGIGDMTCEAFIEAVAGGNVADFLKEAL